MTALQYNLQANHKNTLKMGRGFLVIIWGYEEESSKEVKFKQNGCFNNTTADKVIWVFKSRFYLTVDILGFLLRNKEINSEKKTVAYLDQHI